MGYKSSVDDGGDPSINSLSLRSCVLLVGGDGDKLNIENASSEKGNRPEGVDILLAGLLRTSW
jgi:hypothetical protein